MKDHELRAAYAERTNGRPGERASCPPPEALRALVEREGPEERRLATLDHVMGCAPCRADFELLQTFATARPAVGRRFPLPLAAAAGIALVVSAGLLWTSLRRTGDDTLRGESGGHELLAPLGDIAGRPDRFVWRPVSEAVSYTLEVFTPEGDAVYRTEVRDTAVSLPDSIRLVSKQTYHWWLLVRTAAGRELKTPVASFIP